MASSRRGERCAGTGGVLALALLTAGCPVPMRYTERLAPPLVGVVRSDAGAPVGGVALAVSTSDDCRRPSAADTTDSAGVFRIPAADRRRRVAWVGFEFPPPRPFYLCADPAYAPQIAYTGGVPALPLRKPPLPPDTLTCFRSGEAGARAALRCTLGSGPPPP